VGSLGVLRAEKRKASGGRFLHLQTTGAHHFATPYLVHTSLSGNVREARKSPTWRGGAWGYDGRASDSLGAPNPDADLAVLRNLAAGKSSAMPQSGLVCAGSNVWRPLHGVSNKHGLADFHCCEWKIGSAASALCLRKRNIRFNFHQACSLGVY